MNRGAKGSTFKLKGSPMLRNFGIGGDSPLNQLEDDIVLQTRTTADPTIVAAADASKQVVVSDIDYTKDPGIKIDTDKDDDPNCDAECRKAKREEKKKEREAKKKEKKAKKTAKSK